MGGPTTPGGATGGNLSVQLQATKLVLESGNDKSLRLLETPSVLDAFSEMEVTVWFRNLLKKVQNLGL